MRLTIDQLAELAEVSVRTIRYLLSSGDLAPPEMNGRRGEFGPKHVQRLIEISLDSRRPQGTEAATIEPTKAGAVEDLLRCHVADGIEILIDLERSGLSRKAAQTLFSTVSQLAAPKLTNEPKEHDMDLYFDEATPAGTRVLLDALNKLAFTEEAFRVIHDKAGETMEKHLAYVTSGVTSFKAHSRNVGVNHRLQLCLRKAKQLLESSAKVSSMQWHAIAIEVARTIPLPK